MKNYKIIFVGKDCWIMSNLLGYVVKPYDIKGLIEMHKDHKQYFSKF